jgi:putative resolvase
MKLSEWAKRNRVHYQTAYRWFRSGTLPVPARRLLTGTILVEVPAAADAAGGVALYARVSAHDQREDLDRQLGRLVAWAGAQRLTVMHTVAEVGSG